ncbi:hypothetical protein Cs7R123_45460 [Catellatospora sp. TT07R-123]|uniref:hypothetical protein n=1 Tax=Catellatospora sp. TT07R-123 TaxID=2733863 RepID=UPI001B1A2370|nr:hypothetical protein [Catellatospora sp. TT07R-123]GHJ47204.1 hypothetical protein Cs7R123_45460 [Catellatospora sp. TT07R-123]
MPAQRRAERARQGRTRPKSADTEPTYDIALTYDRLLVIEAARTLIDRIPPLPHGFGHPRV